MRRTGSSFLLLALLASTSVVFAGEDARRVVQKAIQAHGGEANMEKMLRMRIKLDGTSYDPELGQPDTPATIEDICELPNRHRSNFSLQIPGTIFRGIQVIDGRKGWQQLNGGQVEELSEDLVSEFAERKYAESLNRLQFLQDKSIKLSLVDEVKIAGKVAAGVLVKSKGHRDVKLYFDKANGYLVKLEHSPFDSGMGDGCKEELFFSDFQEKQGIRHYMRITVFDDGKKTLDAKVTEIEFLNKLDAKVFAKP